MKVTIQGMDGQRYIFGDAQKIEVRPYRALLVKVIWDGLDFFEEFISYKKITIEKGSGTINLLAIAAGDDESSSTDIQRAEFEPHQVKVIYKDKAGFYSPFTKKIILEEIQNE